MSDRRRWHIAAVALAAVLASPPAFGVAQEPESEVFRLTLDQAMGFASGSNPSLRRATNNTLLNGPESRATWFDQLLPNANLTLFETAFTGNLSRRALDNFGNPIANPSAEWNYFSQTQHRLGLSWSFQGASLFQDHHLQRLANERRDLSRSLALTETQVQVQRRYTDALEQRELLEAEEELIEARRIDLDVVQRLFGLALRTRVDVLNAELALEQQTLARSQQSAAYERALLALKTAMGLSDTRPIEIAETPLPLFDPAFLEAELLIERALQVNPALLQAEVDTRSAEVELSRRKSAWWPRIDLGVAVYRRAYEEYADALFDASLATDLESNFYVQFSLPMLTNFFQEDLERQRASVALSNQRETDREARLQLEESVRGALLELENQWTSLELSERSREIATEALRLAREEYRLGSRTFEDLRSSFEVEADTRRQVITARHRFVDALLALEEAVGAPVRELLPDGPSGSGS